jgi:hypothetical protein
MLLFILKHNRIQLGILCHNVSRIVSIFEDFYFVSLLVNSTTLVLIL